MILLCQRHCIQT